MKTLELTDEEADLIRRSLNVTKMSNLANWEWITKEAAERDFLLIESIKSKLNENSTNKGTKPTSD